MPVLRAADRAAEDAGTPATGPAQAERLTDPGGLTQFGALIETLPPGSASSILHWHAAEDELVLVLQGTVTLIEGAAETQLGPGDAATFRAGVPAGHCLVNRGTAPVRYLVVGSRADADTITYPAHDRVLHRAAGAPARWTDAAGRPAASPYRDPPRR